MKKVIQTVEVDGEGFEALMGETVTLFCLNYFYNGVLVGVNETCILLEDPKIIYETGNFSNTSWKDVQSMGIKELYVQKNAVESFAKTK